MEKLLEAAKKVSDQVEVYSVEEERDDISFENGKLKDIESTMQRGVSLRIIKDGKLGFSYTRNLLDRDQVIQNAFDSLKGRVEAPFDFPLTKEVPFLAAVEGGLGGVSNSTLVEECQRVHDWLASKTRGQVNVSASKKLLGRRLLNSLGTDLSWKASSYFMFPEILYPGSHASIHRPLASKGFEKASDSYLQFIVDLYNLSEREVTPRGGRMKVLFLPEIVYVLIWRIQSATNGRNVFEKVSPLLDKIGEKILDASLTICDDPLNDRWPGARSFDDEGTPCRRHSIVEKGVLMNFYYDLLYAKKLGVSPTGHGWKGGISAKPSPGLEHLFIKPGVLSFTDLLKSMDRGIVIGGALGAHSGNILNGDFSVGLSPGLYVEKGEILGHVKDAMTAGNIYDMMRDVRGIEDTLHASFRGTFPAILFGNVGVAIKDQR